MSFQFVTPAEAARRKAALQANEGSITKAAEALGLSTSCLESWVKRNKGAKPTKAVAPVVEAPTQPELRLELMKLEAEKETLTEQLKLARGVTVKEPITVSRKTRDTKDDFVRVIIPDSHGAHISRPAAAAFLKDLKSLDPDEIVMLGDNLDCGGFLAQHHAMGFVAESNVSYVDDVAAANEFLNQIQEAAPKALTHYIEGNHECIFWDSEVLTSSGWKQADQLTLSDPVAQFDMSSGDISYAHPIALGTHVAPLMSVLGDLSDELVSDNHHLIVDGSRVPVKSLEGRNSCERFRYAGVSVERPLPESDDWLRLMVWTIADACVYWSSPGKCRIQWKLSRPDKIEQLKALLARLAIPYTLAKATKSGLNKLQPYMLRVYGEFAKSIANWIGPRKIFDERFRSIGNRQMRVLLDELAKTDGHVRDNHLQVTTTEESSAVNLQLGCITSGIPCYYTSTDGGSGFPNGRRRYRLSIFPNGLDPKRKVVVSSASVEGRVVAVQMPLGTLITRRNGKVAFTGNCRIERWCVTQALRSQKDSQFLLDVFGPQAVLGLKERGIQYYRSSERYCGLPVPGTIKLGECTFTHGISCGTHATYDHVKKFGISVVHGHTHRAQSAIIRTVGGGVIGGWSPGCLAQLQPLYMATNLSDWSHGYSIQIVSRSGKFQHINVAIIDGESLLNGLKFR